MGQNNLCHNSCASLPEEKKNKQKKEKKPKPKHCCATACTGFRFHFAG